MLTVIMIIGIFLLVIYGLAMIIAWLITACGVASSFTFNKAMPKLNELHLEAIEKFGPGYTRKQMLQLKKEKKRYEKNRKVLSKK